MATLKEIKELIGQLSAEEQAQLQRELIVKPKERQFVRIKVTPFENYNLELWRSLRTGKVSTRCRATANITVDTEVYVKGRLIPCPKDVLEFTFVLTASYKSTRRKRNLEIHMEGQVLEVLFEDEDFRDTVKSLVESWIEEKDDGYHETIYEGVMTIRESWQKGSVVAFTGRTEFELFDFDFNISRRQSFATFPFGWWEMKLVELEGLLP